MFWETIVQRNSMRDVKSCLSRSVCSDLLRGLRDFRNLFYTAIAPFLIRSTFVFTGDTFFADYFASSSNWTCVASGKSGTFSMVVPMNFKACPVDVVTFFPTRFLISAFLLEMKSGSLLHTPRSISRISVLSPTFAHHSIASLYSSYQFSCSCFVSILSFPNPSSCRTLKWSKHFLFIVINPMLRHAFQMRSFVDMRSKGQSLMVSSFFALTMKDMSYP